MNAGDKLTFCRQARASTVQLEGTPELREVKDPFGKHSSDRRARDHAGYIAG